MRLLTGPSQKGPPKSVTGPTFKYKSMGFSHQFYHPKNVNSAKELHADILYLRLWI